MAIAGPGMFMLAKDTLGTIPIESPSKFEYTRNGQFSTDSQNRIVNQNGLLLCGFPADENGNIISGAKSVLTLDQGPLEQQPTGNSKIDLNLDNRLETLKTVFDPTNSTTFSQATSQTIYDQYGNGHILGMFYKKVQTQPLVLTDDSSGGFTFQATQLISNPKQATFEQDRQQNRMSTTFNNSDSRIQAGNAMATNLQTIKGAALDRIGNTSGIGSNWDMRMADGTHLAVKMRSAPDAGPVKAITGLPADLAGFNAGDVLTLTTTSPAATYTNSTFTSATTITEVKAWITGLGANFATGAANAMSHAGPNTGAVTVANGVLSLSKAMKTYTGADTVLAGLRVGDRFTVTTTSPAATFSNTTFDEYTTIKDIKEWLKGTLPAATNAVSHAASDTGALTVNNGVFSVTHDVTTYTVDADRYAVYATIDGFPVGHDPSNSDATKKDANNTIQLSTGTYSEQMSIGTMAFIGGKNIDTLEKGTDGLPVDDNSTSFNIIANGGNNQVNYGRNNSQGDRGVLQFTVKSDNITALTAQGQTYANSQDGHTVSSLTGYSIDSNGKLIATYDNGETSVKGQLILAYFNNVEGLMPNGNNTFAATNKSGEPLLSFPGDGLMGQVRSKSLEQSNVDLTNELVKLMVLQRQYSAMSQATKTMAATIIDDTINIGR